MKKIFLLVICLVMVGIQSVKAQVAIAALHHNDSVKIYSAAHIQTAVDAAVAGDTIYLSEGIFGGFTVTKPIVIIGAGQTTNISSGVTIGKSGNTIEDGLLLSGLNFIQNVSFSGTVSGVRISQCKISGDCSFHAGSSGDNYTNIEILMSHIVGTLNFKATSGAIGLQGITVTNTKIGLVRYGAVGEGGSTFVNCNVNDASNSGSADNSSRNNTYVNCIINNANQGVFKNCLYNVCNSNGDSTGTYAVPVDCYQASTTFSFNDNLDSPHTDEELRQAGYLGVDGTVVGITGGDVPFTLVSSGLQVTEHNIEVDNVGKKLKVTLTLGNK